MNIVFKTIFMIVFMLLWLQALKTEGIDFMPQWAVNGFLMFIGSMFLLLFLYVAKNIFTKITKFIFD